MKAGNPWHGLIQGGVLSLPNGQTINVTGSDLNGDTHYVNFGLPAPENTAADAAAGMEWRNDAIMFGANKRYNPESSRSTGGAYWPFRGDSGNVYWLRGLVAGGGNSAQASVWHKGIPLASNAAIWGAGAIIGASHWTVSHSPSGAVAMLHAFGAGGVSLHVWRVNLVEANGQVTATIMPYLTGDDCNSTSVQTSTLSYTRHGIDRYPYKGCPYFSTPTIVNIAGVAHGSPSPFPDLTGYEYPSPVSHSEVYAARTVVSRVIAVIFGRDETPVVVLRIDTSTTTMAVIDGTATGGFTTTWSSSLVSSSEGEDVWRRIATSSGSPLEVTAPVFSGTTTVTSAVYVSGKEVVSGAPLSMALERKTNNTWVVYNGVGRYTITPDGVSPYEGDQSDCVSWNPKTGQLSQGQPPFGWV